MKIYIEKKNEIPLIKEIKKVKPDVIIENCICEYKPINDYPDPLCDNCGHQRYNAEDGYEYCDLRTQEIQ